MTPEQREELKQAAMKATPGPWHSPGLGELHAENHDEIAQILYAHIDDGYCGTDADADYMARANPSAILSLIAQVEALTVPQWISTADRLPELYEEVMVWPHPTDYCMVSERRPVGFWVYGEYQPGWGHCEETLGTAPTHWMPLPAAPTIPAIPGTKEGA